MDYVLLLAGGCSAFGLVTHLMLGERHPLRSPLDTTDRERQLSADAWQGRHILTALLVMMTVACAHASREPAAHDVVLWLSMICGLAAILRAMASLKATAPLAGLRDWVPLGVSGALGVVGALN